MKLKIKILIFCLLFILPASLSFPQPPGTEMKRWRGESPCWKSPELNLSQEQRKSLNQFQLTYLREAHLLRAQLFTKRLELRELLVDPTIKIESVRAKSLEIIEIRSKQEEKAIEYMIKVRNLLTPEQVKNWCPEREFPAFGTGHTGPMHPKWPFPPTE